ncbi:Core-2/I-Branching enzyme [Ruminococcaceae bacterium YAD3003]|nr:Core-2/I-Branching enzyme [Ruminococcaceae bacterium YAD3003]
MKKIAILILCHKLPNQVNDFISRFDSSRYDFIIHVDKKSNIQKDIVHNENVYFVPDEHRISVEWAVYSQVEAILSLIDTAVSIGSYEYYWLCSGQCFPIKNASYIDNFFEEADKNYMHVFEDLRFDKRSDIYYPDWMIGKRLYQRIIKKLWIILTGGSKYTFSIFRKSRPQGVEKLYHGSTWWCLKNETVVWMLDYISNHPEYSEYYKNAVCPDEGFFHTLINISPFSGSVDDYLVYVDWSEGKSSPKTLSDSDYDTLMGSDKLLARKVDSESDLELYNKLLEI